MINKQKNLEIGEESIVDDEIIIVFDEKLDDDDVECIECVDYFQRKMICLTTILIIATILLVFIYSIGW
tara:strand:- start:767 stop:973 length:207 start_codon:yes stop_codon:yes gene_type:complete